MNERMTKILKIPNIIPISVGVIAFGTGVSVGYILGRRNRNVYEIPPMSDSDKQMYADIEKMAARQKEELVPVEVVEEAKQIGKDFLEQKLKDNMEDELKTDVEFAHNSDEWDYEKELKTRSEADPYVLHKDEFYNDEMDYAQLTLTYYSGDDILVDEDDKPIYNYSRIVGPMLFGHGCDDPNVFHVRNDQRKAEYEILFDPGLYSIEVLGLEIENNDRVKNLKHEANRKFKLD